MAEANEIPTEWYFITAPQNVSWSKNGQSNESPDLCHQQSRTSTTVLLV